MKSRSRVEVTDIRRGGGLSGSRSSKNRKSPNKNHKKTTTKKRDSGHQERRKKSRRYEHGLLKASVDHCLGVCKILLRNRVNGPSLREKAEEGSEAQEGNYEKNNVD